MIISGHRPSPLPAPNPGPRTGRPEGAGKPVATEDPAGTPAPPETPASGPGRAADHRSDVAALRQWINHPERRADLPLPDLTAEHKGNGFAKAVSAYHAATALADPAPVTDPLPTDPADPTVSGDPSGGVVPNA